MANEAVDCGGLESLAANALCCDPPAGLTWPAQTLAQAIQSGGFNLNAVLYAAAGAGPHPTVLLLHGLPGNEQNIDCAQTIRRAGWNVLTIHYRGSWGGPGAFTFANCLQDAASALSWLQSDAAERLRIDTGRIVVIGHSMGGFIAAHTAAVFPNVIGAALISGVDVGEAFGSGGEEDAAVVDDNVGVSAGLHILTGTAPNLLVSEARANAKDWKLANYAHQLIDRHLLVITSDDGFSTGSDALAKEVDRSCGDRLTRLHLFTDHSYSDHRIALQVALLRWLSLIDKILPNSSF